MFIDVRENEIWDCDAIDRLVYNHLPFFLLLKKL